MATISQLFFLPLSTLASYAIATYVVYKFLAVIQRVFFHPLARVPGPTICATSRAYEFWWDSIHHGRLWKKLPELHEKFGPIVRIGPNEVHIHDLEYFQTLLSFRPLNKWAITGREYGVSDALFGTEDYKSYTKKRAAFGDRFSRSSALKMQDLMNEHLNKACEIMKQRDRDGQSIDLAYIYRGAPADIFTEFMFGSQFNFIDDEESTRGLYDRKHEVIFGMWHLGRHMFPMLPLLCDFGWQALKQAAGGPKPKWSMISYLTWASGAVKKLQEEMKDPTQTTKVKAMKPVMETFLEGKLSDADKTISAVSQQGMAAWSGGWETVGTTVTVGTYRVLQSPKMLQRLQTELKTAWPNTDLPPSMEALDNSPYLTAVIKESLRFTPPPGRISRYSPDSVEIYKEYRFPPGTMISTSLAMVSMDPSIWGADAEVFRPERWIGEENKDSRLDEWIVAFSRGARMCPGFEIAYVEMRLLLAHVFRKFELSIDPAAKITDDDVMTYHDGFTGVAKNWCQRLQVRAKPVSD